MAQQQRGPEPRRGGEGGRAGGRTGGREGQGGDGYEEAGGGGVGKVEEGRRDCKCTLKDRGTRSGRGRWKWREREGEREVVEGK